MRRVAFDGPVGVLMIDSSGCDDPGSYADMNVAVDGVLSTWRDGDEPVVFVLSDSNGSPAISIHRDCNNPTIAHVMDSSGEMFHFGCRSVARHITKSIVRTFIDVTDLDIDGFEISEPRFLAA